MTKSNKKMLLVLSAVVVACGLALFWLRGNPSIAAKGVWLTEIPTGEIVGVEIQNAAQPEPLCLARQEEQWQMQGREEGVEGKRMAGLLAVLGYLKASDVVENGGENLEEYGLDSPQTTIVLQHKAGEETFYIGTSLPEKGAYLARKGDTNVYFVDELRAQTLTEAAKNFLEVPLNGVDFNKIVGLELKNETAPPIHLNQSESPRSQADFYWSMNKPYACNAKGEEVEKLVEKIAEIGWIQYATGTTLQSSGLEQNDTAELILYDVYDRSLALQLGNIAEDGKRYCRLNKGNDVYTIDETVWKILQTTADELVDETLYYYETASVTECVFDWQQNQFRLQAEWITTEEQGNVQRFTRNGSPLAGGSYHTLAQQISAIQTEQTAQWQVENATLEGGLYIRRMSAPYEQAILFYTWQQDQAYVAVDYGGPVVMLVKREALNTLQEQFAMTE